MLNRFTYVLLALTIAAALFFYFKVSADPDSPPRSFVGTDRCGVCHAGSGIGAQNTIWRNGPHARAYEVLQSDSALRLLNSGRFDLERDCLGCHTTLGRRMRGEDERHLLEEGVGCERCHGAGSNYSRYDIMLERQSFTAHGGRPGSLEDCYSCHSRSPATDSTHCPFQTRPFEADTSWYAIRHPIPPSHRRRDTLSDIRTP